MVSWKTYYFKKEDRSKRLSVSSRKFYSIIKCFLRKSQDILLKETYCESDSDFSTSDEYMSFPLVMRQGIQKTFRSNIK